MTQHIPFEDFFLTNRNLLYGSAPSRQRSISSISVILRSAHRNRVFQVEGSSESPSRYFLVCLAYSLNSFASSMTNPGLSTRFHGTRTSVFSLLSQWSPRTSSLSMVSFNHSQKPFRFGLESGIFSFSFYVSRFWTAFHFLAFCGERLFPVHTMKLTVWMSVMVACKGIRLLHETISRKALCRL